MKPQLILELEKELNCKNQKNSNTIRNANILFDISKEFCIFTKNIGYTK